MTLVPRFCIRLALALGFLALFGIAAFNQSASAQTTGSKPDPNRRFYMIVRAPDGGTICREATEQEAKAQLQRSANGQQLQQINHLKHTLSAEVNGSNPGGLNIYLFGTAQLNNFPAARDAFVRAAAAWEAIIKTPMSVYLEVDYGPTGFGEPWDDENVIGATNTRAIPKDYPSVRNNLIVSASNGSESSLYSLLPSITIPTDLGNVGTMEVNVSLARALGLIDANADVAQYRQRIAFNSGFDFDTDSSNNITPGQMDFEAVATHEIGHALGFDSANGGGTPPRVAVWDLFRFRPGVANFTTNQRIMTVGGGLHVYYAGGPELGLATGGPNPGPTDGDGDQSSHWRDNNSANFNTAIGIMDPNIALGTHEFIKPNDINALNFMGYNMETNTPPPPPPPPPGAPANDNFVNAQVITGCTGTVNGTNIGATKEGGEPSHSPDNDPGGASVWYRWQAPSTGSVTITTAGSDYDTVLAVYSGTSVGGLSLITRNDDVTLGTFRTSSVTFNATANTVYRIAVDGWNADTGNITLNWTAQNCNVTPPTCTYSISPGSLNFNGGGGSGATVSVTAGAGCAWTAQSNSSFITITAGASGSGNGTVTYSVAANTGSTSSRTGTMTIAGQTFTVTQDAGLSCSYSISPFGQTFAAAGGSGATVSVSGGPGGGPGCPWTAVSNDSFITITNGASGSGSGTVTYSVAPNSGAARIGTMTIAGMPFTVTQNSATPSISTLQLSLSSYDINESSGSTAILVNRSGDLSTAVTVNYTTSDSSDFLQNCNVVNGKATSRCDYISLVGTLHFAPNENSKTLSVPIVDDTYLENAETFFLTLSNPSNGAVLGANRTATITITDNSNDGIGLSNPIDTTNFFVRQHYMDFLGREPDPASIGWNNQINNCVPLQPSCDRLSVSQGIYSSPEFKDRGYFIYKFFATALGRKPTYDEFVLDRARVSGFQTEAELEQSKLDFIADFMNRAEFHTIYDSQGTNRSFVETILSRAQMTYANKENLIQSMDGGFITRAGALRAIAESGEANSRFLVESTIVMHYFGYLRRDPDAAYQDWINIFNQTGDSRNVTNGFVNSLEYRNRFSQ
ncbi:MAG TPA: NF038122 family metalloprotease [Pyrinomonadaceae bacterium]|jgi:hypothetical protein|nr:NF038122 family metalloprotease [Pyrinomonadaceae bacterium]